MPTPDEKVAHAELAIGDRREAAGTRGVGASLSLLGTGLAYVWRKRRS